MKLENIMLSVISQRKTNIIRSHFYVKTKKQRAALIAQLVKHPPAIQETPTQLLGWRKCAHLLLQEFQNYNSLLNNHPQENVGSHQKKITHVQEQRRSPSKMVGGMKLHLESNSIPTRDTQRAQTKPWVHQETPQRLSQTCLWVF